MIFWSGQILDRDPVAELREAIVLDQLIFGKILDLDRLAELQKAVFHLFILFLHWFFGQAFLRVHGTTTCD